jgi:hypothetical protein
MQTCFLVSQTGFFYFLIESVRFAIEYVSLEIESYKFVNLAQGRENFFNGVKSMMKGVNCMMRKN